MTQARLIVVGDSETHTRLIADALCHLGLDASAHPTEPGQGLTDAAQAAKSSPHSDEDFRLLTEYSPDVIFRCSVVPSLEVTYLSPAIANIAGHAPQVFYGPASRLLALVEPDDRAMLEASWHIADTARLVTRWRRHDCSSVWLEQRLVGIYEDGTLVGIEGILRDVTDRILAERERDQMVYQFQQSERLASLGNFAGHIAHDFNNVLAVILGAAEFVSSSLGPESPSRDDVETIQKAAEQGVALTRHLRIFARRQPVRPQTLDLNTVLRELADMVRHTLDPEIALEFDLADGLDPVSVDRDGLEQSVLNLAQNANCAMADGGRLTIATMPVQLPEPGEHNQLDGARMLPGSYTRLVIADTGCGMAPDVAERAFEPLFTAGPGRAAGLGLTVVREVVDKAGGRIVLRTRVNEGTTVTIDLPTTLMAAEVVEPPVAIDGAGETVLVVEDDDAVRDIVARLLVAHKYHVRTARRGAEALELSLPADSGIDVLLSDMIMPGMDGPELVEKLRSKGRDIPVLYMSGYTPDHLPTNKPFDRALVIDKPFDAPTLLGRLREVLERAHGRVASNPRHGES